MTDLPVIVFLGITFEDAMLHDAIVGFAPSVFQMMFCDRRLVALVFA